MSIQELLTQSLQMDLAGLSTLITANAAFLKSIEFDKVVTELLMPWMRAKSIPEDQRNVITQEIRRFIQASTHDTLIFTSVAAC